ncbi:MAG: 30S ribosomal protein S5 [Anaerolineae bacterium]|nr:30S ribosomal protein S5 [Anaerolineae bacterium]
MADAKPNQARRSGPSAPGGGNRGPSSGGQGGGRGGRGGPGAGRGGRGGPGAGRGGPNSGQPFNAGGDSRGGPRQDRPVVDEFEQKIVDITRVAKVIKGGRRFAFRALIVVGDGKGKIGIGMGRARAVQDAIRKATDSARASMKQVNLLDHTIPHEVIMKYGGAKVLLKPASPGTGVIAGGGVRAVLVAAGVKNVLTKSLGSGSKMNATYATFDALMQLKNLDDEAKRRGKDVNALRPFPKPVGEA